MVTTGEGQGNWVRSRLLCEGISLFGVQFLDARSLRRELCLRLGIAPPVLGGETLEFLLRLYALRRTADGAELASVARHPGACLAAMGDLADAGWLDDPTAVFGEVMPATLGGWLPELEASGAWTPEVDRQLLARAEPSGDGPPLSVCVFGWEASLWPSFNLLLATLRAADHAEVYTPLPRGTSEALQQEWLEALEQATGGEIDICEASGFPSSQADLVARLEGADFRKHRATGNGRGAGIARRRG